MVSYPTPVKVQPRTCQVLERNGILASPRCKSKGTNRETLSELGEESTLTNKWSAYGGSFPIRSFW